MLLVFMVVQGCGKTRLIKEGLCKALNLPFVFIPLGGINDSSYLTGHSFTYEVVLFMVKLLILL